MAHFGANSAVYFNRNVRLFTARTTTVTVLLAADRVLLLGLFRGGAVNPPQKILGLFHLKWLIFVQTPLYFNRTVRLFTARTTTVTCIHVLLAAEGEREPVEPPSLRACGSWHSRFPILPIDIVTAPSLNSFKNRSDKHWLQQDIKYNWESELSGTGSRSYIHVC